MSYIQSLSDIQQTCYEIAKDHGWWEAPDNVDTIPAKLMLVVSECAEALEAYRIDQSMAALQSMAVVNGKPEGFVVELADAVIRIFDLAEHLNLNLEQAIYNKMAYNRTRPYRHGGKAV